MLEAVTAMVCGCARCSYVFPVIHCKLLFVYYGEDACACDVR